MLHIMQHFLKKERYNVIPPIPNYCVRPGLSLTIGGVFQHQALQVGPLTVESFHQFECIDWVPQESLWVLRSCVCQWVQFVCPPDASKETKYSPAFIELPNDY